jgi:hypothetical protein
MMKREVWDKKISVFCSFLNITEDAIKLRDIENDQDFIDQIISLFKENNHIFNGFLYKIFDLRVRYAFKEVYEEGDFTDDQPIEDILPKGFAESRLKYLESEIKLIFPRPVLSKLSLSVQLALFLLPVSLFILAIVFHVEFLIVLYGLVKLGIIIILILLPNLIGYFLFPKFYQPSKLVGINTYHDLIQDLVLMNRYYYTENDYKLTAEELKDFLQSL